MHKSRKQEQPPVENSYKDVSSQPKAKRNSNQNFLMGLSNDSMDCPKWRWTSCHQMMGSRAGRERTGPKSQMLAKDSLMRSESSLSEMTNCQHFIINISYKHSIFFQLYICKYQVGDLLLKLWLEKEMVEAEPSMVKEKRKFSNIHTPYIWVTVSCHRVSMYALVFVVYDLTGCHLQSIGKEVALHIITKCSPSSRWVCLIFR